MRESKSYMCAFLVGGIYAAIGQVFLLLYVSILGPESPYLMALTLASMGVIALITYTTGIHQRVSAWSGWGSILPFNGFACAVADMYEKGAKDGFKGSILNVIDLVLWVIGTGALLSIVVGIAAFFLAA